MSEIPAPPESKRSARKRRPLFVRILVGIAAVFVVLVLVLQFALGPIVKSTAEGLGPMILGTRVEVTNAYARILSGVVRLEGVVVGPPEGFDANLFEMQNFRASIDVRSLLGGTNDPVVIRDITIEGPFVTYELKGIRDNLHALLDKLGADDGEENPEKEKETEAEKAPGRKVIIEHFLFKDARVRVAVAHGKGVPIPLPDIELRDIGRNSGGATVLAATGQILRQITVGTVKAAAGAAVDLGGAAVDAAGEVVGAATEAAGKAIDAIGSLFGSSEKDRPKDGK